MISFSGGISHNRVRGDSGLGERLCGGFGEGKHQRVADLQGAVGAGEGEVQPVARAAAAAAAVNAHGPPGPPGLQPHAARARATRALAGAARASPADPRATQQ